MSPLRRFAVRLAIFGLPFVAWGVLIALIDPLEFLGAPSFIEHSIKEGIALNVNPVLWKLGRFRERPCSNVLFGDSRMELLEEEEVTQTAGDRYFNFAFGGASLQETIDAYWFAASRVRLANVYIGINFQNYSEASKIRRTPDYLRFFENPLLYWTDRTVLRAAARASWCQLTGASPRDRAPDMDRRAFWKHQLGTVTEGIYGNYRKPQFYRKELARLAAHAQQNGTRLRFVILPTHVELQKRIDDFGLRAEEAAFRQDLASIATTFDFDYLNPLTQQEANFSDPYHFVHPVATLVVGEIWPNAELIHGRVLSEKRTPLSRDRHTRWRSNDE